MYPQLTSLFCLSLLTLNAVALYSGPNGVSPARHISRNHHNRAVTKPSPSQDFKPKVKRASGTSSKQKRCAAKAAGVNNVVVDSAPPADVTTTIATTTTHTHATTSTHHAAPPAPTPAAQPKTTPAGSGSDSGGEFDQSKTYKGGDATYYGIGLGACGWTNTEPDLIVAMAFAMFDGFATTSAEKNNPNLNPVCGQFIEASLPGLSSVRVKVVDRCGGCTIPTSLDFSEAAFNILTNNGMAVGRFHELSWHFTD